MPIVRDVYQNTSGGCYEPGKPYSDTKWASIVDIYQRELEAHCKCSIRTLHKHAKILLKNGVLKRGDVFIVDNCSVHTNGNNVGTQRSLFDECGIFMITLPPYHPVSNPTELIYNSMVQRI